MADTDVSTTTLIQNVHALAQAAGSTDRVLADSIASTNQLAVAAGTAASQAHQLAQQAKQTADEVTSTTLTVSKSGKTVTITATDKNGTTMETVSDGEDGADGSPGAPGATGPAPAHRWVGTNLQFQNPDDTWGDAVDLRGTKGDDGAKGDPGDSGPAPSHRWVGTSLQFQNPDGSWDNGVDLKGPQGDAGESAAGYELCEFYFFRHPTLRSGFVQAAGGLITNAATRYPKAFAYLQTTAGQLLCKTEAEWQAMSTAIYYTDAEGNQEGWNGVGGVPWFVIDTNAGTIRVPDIRGMYAEAAGLDSLAVGGVHGPGVPNITGSVDVGFIPDQRTLTGAFAHGKIAYGYIQTPTTTNSTYFTVDASRSSGAYGAGGAQRVRPRAWAALACVYLGS
ncbi:hypothetical protein [uncultured Desulfovibrio sp.]|uniref:hypothetical protein n=1 Tax=uncultured Desulfovibrio sp. TaxID=167968 RepID=UPI0026080038|nr:hypothetical protein [uncultured Desulfovibrio sp.]